MPSSLVDAMNAVGKLSFLAADGGLARSGREEAGELLHALVAAITQFADEHQIDLEKAVRCRQRELEAEQPTPQFTRTEERRTPSLAEQHEQLKNFKLDVHALNEEDIPTHSGMPHSDSFRHTPPAGGLPGRLAPSTSTTALSSRRASDSFNTRSSSFSNVRSSNSNTFTGFPFPTTNSGVYEGDEGGVPDSPNIPMRQQSSSSSSGQLSMQGMMHRGRSNTLPPHLATARPPIAPSEVLSASLASTHRPSPPPQEENAAPKVYWGLRLLRIVKSER